MEKMISRLESTIEEGVINEDESLFLKTVEEANADLERIFSITEKKGELTDDFSLLRIEFNDPYPVNADQDTSHLKLALEYYNKDEFRRAYDILEQITEPTLSKSYLRLKANTVYKMGDFYQAAELYSSFVDLYPEESTFLFATAKSYKMIGKSDLAADYLSV
ncbi:MAG: hypothetical protein IPG24_12825 [Leptospiraceae bacterium]|nr:hypothetical protein [Leptospiraceae bacterium]